MTSGRATAFTKPKPFPPCAYKDMYGTLWSMAVPPVLRKTTLPLPRSVICGSSFEMAAVELAVLLLPLRLVSTTRFPVFSISRNWRLKHLPY